MEEFFNFEKVIEIEKKKSYNKALEDFAEELLKHKSKDEYPVMCFDEFTVNKFVDQLKK